MLKKVGEKQKSSYLCIVFRRELVLRLKIWITDIKVLAINKVKDLAKSDLGLVSNKVS